MDKKVFQELEDFILEMREKGLPIAKKLFDEQQYEGLLSYSCAEPRGVLYLMGDLFDKYEKMCYNKEVLESKEFIKIETLKELEYYF